VADEVPFERQSGQRGPLGFGFLNVVLAERTLARGMQFRDRSRGLPLGHGQ